MQSLVTVEGSPPSLALFDLLRAPFRAGLDELDSQRFVALLYAAPAEGVAGSPGRLTTASNSRGLPPPDRIEILDSDERVWRRSESIPADIAALKIAQLCPCFGLYEGRTEIRVDAPALTVDPRLALADEMKVVLSVQDSLHEVTGDGVEVSVSPGLGPIRGMWIDRSSTEIWLATDGGLSHGTIAGGFAPDVGPWPGPVVALAGPSDPAAPFELFVASSDGRLARLADGTWTEIREPTAILFDRGKHVLSWAGPGSVIESVGDERIFEHGGARDGFTNIDLPPRPSQDGVTAVGWIPRLGPLIGTRWGTILRRRATQWEVIRDSSGSLSRNTGKVDFISLMPGGSLLYGGESGLALQYDEQYGYCPATQPIGGHNITSSVTLGDVVVLAHATAGTAFVNFVPPTRQLCD